MPSYKKKTKKTPKLVIIKARKPKAVSKNQRIIPGSNPKESLAQTTQACFCKDTRKKGKEDKASDTSAAISSSELYFL